MPRGIKRCRSASKCGELVDTQPSQPGDRLRKRSRRDRNSSVLRGGSYTSKFGWPYNPVVSDEEIVQWCKRMEKPIRDLFETRKGSDRGGVLTQDEVRALDEKVGQKLHAMYDVCMRDPEIYNMMRELQNLFRFINLVVVTNVTPNTSVKLNSKPLVNSLLEYNCPLALRVEDAYSGGPVVVYNWRPGSGGTKESPNKRLIHVSVKSLKIERQGESLLVRLPCAGGDIEFRVEWFGPKALYRASERNELCFWKDVAMRIPNISDSLKQPIESSPQELLKLWMPYIKKLAETKMLGVHKTLPRNHFCDLQEYIKQRLSLYEAIARGEKGAPAFSGSYFWLFMRFIRVVNLTPGSIVLFRNTIAPYIFQHLDVTDVMVYLVDVVAAEVHLLETDEILPLTRDMVTVRVVEDCLEAVIDVKRDHYVVLRIAWLGPNDKTPHDLEWENFMRLYRSTLVYSDTKRSIELYGRYMTPVTFRRLAEHVEEARIRAEAAGTPRSWSAVARGM